KEEFSTILLSIIIIIEIRRFTPETSRILDKFFLGAYHHKFSNALYKLRFCEGATETMNIAIMVPSSEVPLDGLCFFYKA
ncbi:hypothetical protein ACJX0J_034524, partial [Zea mays]